jgi:transposase
MVAPMVFEGAMTGEMFVAYVEQCLVPTLKRTDIVVMDNLRAHKVAGVREAIEAAGSTLRYLPQYSPDLNLSRRPSANSKPSCARSSPARCLLSGEQFDPSSRVSTLANVPTTSGIQDMFPYDRNPL